MASPEYEPDNISGESEGSDEAEDNSNSASPEQQNSNQMADEDGVNDHLDEGKRVQQVNFNDRYDSDIELNKNPDYTGDKLADSDEEKALKMLTRNEIEALLGELFRIIDTFCERKPNIQWKEKFIKHWASERHINVNTIKILG